MLSVSEALQQIKLHVPRRATVRMSLRNAQGFVLAEDILSPIHFPDVRQAAVDGYGVSLAEINVAGNTGTFLVQEIIQAGSTEDVVLQPNYCVRIFTGAMVPLGVDCVVMQEYCTRDEQGRIVIPKQYLTAQANIRAVASQCEKGDRLLQAHTTLTPGGISLLASVGIHEVFVFSKPVIGILPTGKELVQPGAERLPGQVFESNSWSLSAGLQQLQLAYQLYNVVDDELDTLAKQIAVALEQCDVLLITGGVSVGDYDFVLEACKLNKVQTLFHKVKQRPGKPLYFGKTERNILFGLPGNPASVLSCFYLFVYPALRQCMGADRFGLTAIPLPLLADFNKKAGLTFFLRGELKWEGVHIPSGQESYKMNAFAKADCIIELDEEREVYTKGEMVKVYLLPS